MMVSFLAYLEGGVSLGSEESGRVSDDATNKRNRPALRLPSAARILGASFETGAIASDSDPGVDFKIARHHTAASLFNALYGYLHQDGQVTFIQDTGVLSSLTPGQLVEIEGEYAGNPLEELLAVMGQFLAYIDTSEEKEARNKSSSSGNSRNPRSGNPAKRDGGGSSQRSQSEEERLLGELERISEMAEKQQTDFAMRICRKMSEDIGNAPVHDLLINVGDRMKAVLTVSSEYYSPATNERLRAGHFRVLGKVTRILQEDDEVINLARRTVLGAASGDVAKSLIDGSQSGQGLNMSLSDPLVKAPALQVLPMAIFV
jgi:hypothetical protein